MPRKSVKRLIERLDMALTELIRVEKYKQIPRKCHNHVHGPAYPSSILYISIPSRYRPVSYPDGPITARYRFI